MTRLTRTRHRANCRHIGCRTKTRAVYVVAGLAVRLCQAHRHPDLAIASLKPVERL